MSASEAFVDLDDELAATRRMLERYPDGRGAWRPHAKSRMLAQLATHVAEMPNRGVDALTKDGIDVMVRTPKAPLDTAAELLATFDASADKVRSSLATITDADLDRTWTMRAGDRVLLSAPKRDVVRRMMLNHMIHHRAQLGDYYRLLDIPVPGMYGPSADDAPPR